MPGLVGCEPLSQLFKPIKPGQGYKYKDYLNPSVRPYISRDAYVREHPEASGLTGEAAILERLMTSQKHGGVMIYGDGGIGKTRLMLELGLMAEKNGWVVYYISHQLQDLSRLKSCLTPGNHYLLMFDSIEDHPLFTCDLIDKLEQIAPGVSVKAAANCRTIYSFASTFPQSKEFLTVELTLKGKEAPCPGGNSQNPLFPGPGPAAPLTIGSMK